MLENGKIILVIDDDPDIGMMIHMMLQFKGFAVTVLENTEKAETILQQGNVQLLILDMLLSGTNGVDICRDFKGKLSIAHIPIIMMSAHPDAKVICLNAGANDFILKPFDMEEMYLMINKFIIKAST
jgi:DNA-binding response OmpR family regulator